MPDHQREKKRLKQSVTFDRDEIRSKISRYSYVEARRLQGPIYDVLVQELHEEGCLTAGRHFCSLAEKESGLYQRSMIRERLCDDRPLLFALYDNFKRAEQTALFRHCGCLAVSYRLLYQGLMLIEERGLTFDWLLADVYKIVTRIVQRIGADDESSREMQARLFFRYGLYLSKKNDEIPESIEFLKKARELVRGEMWPDDGQDEDEPCSTLHERVARVLTKVLLKYAKIMARQYKADAVRLVSEAITTIAEVGTNENKELYCRANMARAEFLMDDKNFEEALVVLNKIEEILAGHTENKFLRLSCEMFLVQGTCHTILNDREQALTRLQSALDLSCQLNLKNYEAEAQLNLGKLYANSQTERQKAKIAFENAKDLFVELDDVENKKKTLYLLAKLKADKVFPFFMNLIRDTNEHYCSLYNLRQWKTLCHPFWVKVNENLSQQEKDEIYCLLESGSNEWIKRKFPSTSY